MSVAGIVLAAGFSRRLGRPKQMVRIAGETLVERSVRIARGAGLEPIFVVWNGDSAVPPSLHAPGCTVVLNNNAHEGLASSIRAGVRAAQGSAGVQGVVLMTCDQPGTRPEHLRALYGEPNRMTGSDYAGKTAVPAYFPAMYFDHLLELQGDAGARVLLARAHGIEAQGLEIDVDTEQDIARAKLLFESSEGDAQHKSEKEGSLRE